MYKKAVILSCVILLVTSSIALAGVPLKINNKDIREGEMVALFGEDLEGGKLTVSTPADEDIDGAEISFDKGRTWEKMEREGGRFIGKYRPRDGEKMTIVLMFKKATGETSLRSTNVTVYFQKMKPDAAILLVLEKMQNAYEAENLGRFMDLISMRFPNRVQFEQAIQNDFYNYNNIRLHFRVDRAVNDPNFKGSIWDVYWERKFLNRSGTESSDTAHIAMKFNKDMDRWLIGAMNGNTIFGSSLATSSLSPDLSVTPAGISGGYVGPNYFINAIIVNNGNAPASNFRVQFAYTQGATTIGYETVGTINANSQVTVRHSIAPTIPGAGDSVTVTIDPDNVLSGDSKGNNVATKNFPF